jgi:hypothetical protein
MFEIILFILRFQVAFFAEKNGHKNRTNSVAKMLPFCCRCPILG